MASARFRLWAPGAAHVALELTHERGRHLQPLAAEEGGWFSAAVSNLAAGARYRYRIDDRISVPDPASRSNPEDVHAASAVVDPLAFDWTDDVVARAPVGRGGGLRAARRHVHARRHVRRGGRAAGLPRATWASPRSS